MSKTKTQNKDTPRGTRTVHVPIGLHQEIAIKAIYRRQDIQEVAAEALRIGLSALPSTPQVSPN